MADAQALRQRMVEGLTRRGELSEHGHPTGPDGRGNEVTSSASMPAVMAQMLTALAAEPGMRVLEIGTGPDQPPSSR